MGSLFHHEERVDEQTTYVFRGWHRPEGWSWTVNVRKLVTAPWGELLEARSAWTVVHDPPLTLSIPDICSFALDQCQNALNS